MNQRNPQTMMASAPKDGNAGTLVDYVGQTLESHLPAIEADSVEKFRKATSSEHSGEVALTYATLFREAEYQWLDVFQTDMRYLLHGDQEYEYFSPLKIGDKPHLITKVVELKERKSRGMLLQFTKLESEIRVDGVVKMKSRTGFIVRKPLDD